MEQESKLSFSIKFGWAIGELAIAAFVVLQMGFMLFYCTQALKIPPTIAGIALLLPRLLDAIADPFMGALSDRTKSPFGRRRIYLLIGAPLLGLSFASVFFVPVDAPMVLKVTLLVLSFMASNAAVTIYEVPYSSMAAEMTQNYRERTSMAGYKMVAARLGGLVAVFFAPQFLKESANLAEGFRNLGIASGIFMFATGIWTFFSSKNAPTTIGEVKRFSLKDEIQAVLANKNFASLWLAFLVQNLAIGVTATSLLYFLTYVMQIPSDKTGNFMVFGSIAALLTTPLWVMLGRRIGKYQGYFVGLIAAIILCIPAFLMEAEFLFFMIPLLTIMGSFDAANQLFPNAMVPDTVEADELQTGQRREGAIFGAWGFARKLGMTGGAFLVSVFLGFSGFISGVSFESQPFSAILGIKLLFSVLPLFLWICTFFLFGRYELTESEFEKVKSQIQSRKIDQ